MMRILLFMWLVSQAHADGANAPSAFELSLMQNGINSRESYTEINGRKFRRIEYDNKVYYLQLLASETTAGDGPSCYAAKLQLVNSTTARRLSFKARSE